MAFEFDLVKFGKRVHQIKFIKCCKSLKYRSESFDSPPKPLVRQKEEKDWKNALLKEGISEKSIADIVQMLGRGVIEEGYILYVIYLKKTQQRQNNIHSSLSGAIYKSIVERYDLPSYEDKKAKSKLAVARPIEKKIIKYSQRELESMYEHSKTSGAKSWKDISEYVNEVYRSNGFE
jgi:hypothetical protein